MEITIFQSSRVVQTFKNSYSRGRFFLYITKTRDEAPCSKNISCLTGWYNPWGRFSRRPTEDRGKDEFRRSRHMRRHIVSYLRRNAIFAFPRHDLAQNGAYVSDREYSFVPWFLLAFLGCIYTLPVFRHLAPSMRPCYDRNLVVMVLVSFNLLFGCIMLLFLPRCAVTRAPYTKLTFFTRGENSINFFWRDRGIAVSIFIPLTVHIAWRTVWISNS